MNTIEQTLRALADREREFVEATKDLPAIEHAFKVKEAMEYLKADGNVEARKATARQNCSAEYLEFLKAEARAVIAKEKLNDARASLSAKQTILTNETRTNAATQRFQT